MLGALQSTFRESALTRKGGDALSQKELPSEGYCYRHMHTTLSTNIRPVIVGDFSGTQHRWCMYIICYGVLP